MKIEVHPDFPEAIKGKWLLLDTCVFIDASKHSNSFRDFFNILKSNNVVLVTVKSVLIEFLSGSSDVERFNTKKQYFDGIVDSLLPITDDVYDLALEISSKYGQDGKDLGVTDFLLGALLKKYSDNLYLLSRNTNDFLTDLYPVKSIINMITRRAIWSYGVYSG